MRIHHNCVDAAVDFGMDPSNDGHGFTIKIELDTGTVVEGAVLAPDTSGNVLMLVTGEGIEIFIDKRRAVSAAVIW